MNKILETKNVTVWFDANRQYQKNSWTTSEKDISESEIKETISLCTQLIVKNCPKYYLADDSKRQFPYNVDIQNWVAATLADACIKGGVTKFAVIMPADTLSELSTEQVGDEVGQIPFKIKYFQNETAAVNWLFE